MEQSRVEEGWDMFKKPEKASWLKKKHWWADLNPHHRFFRPRATKKMTVELVRNAPSQGPFVWPDPPTDFAP